MKIVSIIPARLNSSRFPGKPLAQLHGKPMIEHVFEKVSKNKKLHDTVVATCDTEISEHIISIGGQVIMTSNQHERASDRCAEALIHLEKENRIKYDIVVMVQGDEPMIHHEMISEAVQPLIDDPVIMVSNLMTKILDYDEFNDPNCIKVVCDKNSNALYMSREPIPTRLKVKKIPMYKQVCVIPFRRNFLIEYTNMEPTQLEISESIDMLRILENGIPVKMIPTRYITHAVDTPEDLSKVEILMKENYI